MKKTILILFSLFSFITISCAGNPSGHEDSTAGWDTYSIPSTPTLTTREHYSAEAMQKNQFILENDILQVSGYIRAVSLGNLQQALAACEHTGCPSELLELGELTSLFGFIRDDSGDLLLLGHADPRLPPILTEDLVVALRNAWYLYAEIEGNTRFYASPAVSIDPNPQVMADLNALIPQLYGSEQNETAFHQWENICANDQEVVVLGIPFQTNFAKILVDADYYLKDIVNGNNPLGIAGLTSLMDMHEQRCLEELNANGNLSPFSTNNRFWFYAGQNSYITDEGIVLIQDCPVELQTELLEGDADPLAGDFAAAFTVHYQEIASEEPIYRQQENIFRLFAVAKILAYDYEETGIMPDLDYFLYEYPLTESIVPSYLPGRSAIREIHYDGESPNGTAYTIDCYLPSCGGVDLNIDPIPTDFDSAQIGNAGVLAAKISQNKLKGSVFYDAKSDLNILFTVNYDHRRLGEFADRIASQLGKGIAVCYLKFNDFPDFVAKNKFMQDVKVRQAAMGRETTTLELWDESITDQETVEFFGAPVIQVKLEPTVKQKDKDNPASLTTIFAFDGNDLKIRISGENGMVLEKLRIALNKVLDDLKEGTAVEGLVNPTSAAILNIALLELTPEERETLDILTVLDSSTQFL